MTYEEFSNLKSEKVFHLALADEHATTHRIDYEKALIYVCIHTPVNGRKKPYIHYMVDGKVYKNKDKFIEAIRDL